MVYFYNFILKSYQNNVKKVKIMNSNSKFVFVTGGVMSGIGKGVATASIGKVLQFRGFKVSVVKIDPYLNPSNLSSIRSSPQAIVQEESKQSMR